LSVAPRVVVWLQDEIVLVLVDLDGSAKIAAFESGLKEQSVVVGPLRHVEGRDLTIRCLSLLVWRWVDGIVHDPIHEVLLVCYAISLSP